MLWPRFGAIAGLWNRRYFDSKLTGCFDALDKLLCAAQAFERGAISVTPSDAEVGLIKLRLLQEIRRRGTPYWPLPYWSLSL